MKPLLSFASVFGLSISAVTSALAQSNPGDDYVRTCTNTQTYETVNLYSGLAVCTANFQLNGTLYSTTLSEFVQPTTFSSKRIYGFPGGTLASCVAPVPFWQTVTRLTGTVQQCTSTPQQPFSQVVATDYGCAGGATNYGLSWPHVAGDLYILEWKVGNTFEPYAGTYAPPYMIAIGSGDARTFRLRTMRNGTSGSWSYVTLPARCSSSSMNDG